MVDKAAVFIDLGYLSKVGKNEFHSAKIDFLKFSDKLCGECNRFRTYIYDCPPYQDNPPTDDQRERKAKFDTFHYSLTMLPRFEVRLGRLSKHVDPHNGLIAYQQKGTDTLLSVDLTRLSWGKVIDKAILVTGDSDFVPAVKSAKEAMVIIELFYSEKQHASDELVEACDERFHITKELIDSCLRNGQKNKP